ncbi:MAG: hypothetical protein HOQ22_08230 [Nocardioidaceae bacterium]|nr:hypothetical protein [Nocardioidaceae bacterium]
MRVYVPSSFLKLRAIVLSDGIGPAPFSAHGVTDALRAAYPDGDDEDWEYAATSAAAESSVAVLTEDDKARRVVVAVDVPSARPVGGDDPTMVTVDDVVPMRKVAAVLADTEDAEDDVDAARDALAAGADDVADRLERCRDHELAWYANQEIADLLED